MTVALDVRLKMNAFQERVFILFYAGHSRKHIADLCNTTLAKVNYVLDKYGDEWVVFHVRKDILSTIHRCLKEHKSPELIAEILNLKPTVIKFIRKRLPPELDVPAPIKPKPDDARLTIRCSNCGAQFSSSLFELESNPNRLCKVCNADNATE